MFNYDYNYLLTALLAIAGLPWLAPIFSFFTRVKFLGRTLSLTNFLAVDGKPRAANVILLALSLLAEIFFPSEPGWPRVSCVARCLISVHKTFAGCSDFSTVQAACCLTLSTPGFIWRLLRDFCISVTLRSRSSCFRCSILANLSCFSFSRRCLNSSNLASFAAKKHTKRSQHQPVI